MIKNSTKGSRLTPARGRGPADHRRHGAGGAANDNVLRRRALEPHRIDENVEADGEREQRGGDPIGHQPQAKAPSPAPAPCRTSALPPGLTNPRGTGRAAVRAIWASISASYHILSAPEAPAPAAMQISAAMASTGCIEPGAATRPTRPGEHHEEHHARLHQRDVIGDVAAGLGFDRSGPCRICDVSHAHSLDCREARGVPNLQASVDLRRGSVSPAMEWRRRGQRPFQCRGAHSPRIGGCVHFARERLMHAVEETEQSCESYVRADRGRQSSSRRRRPDSPRNGAACRLGPGSAAGRRPGSHR